MNQPRDKFWDFCDFFSLICIALKMNNQINRQFYIQIKRKTTFFHHVFNEFDTIRHAHMIKFLWLKFWKIHVILT